MSKESNSSSGIGFAGLLTIAFIVLKLCNVIDWSWWWVLSPVWISVALFIVIGIPLIVWVSYTEAKTEKLREEKEAEFRRSGKASKFQQRLQEVMDANKAEGRN